ncbi:MAG: hypothetical protein JWL59_2008 [Chthoniobacteraceae bacterium]|nr:hypothetical protein [Chthoniobacteraceae bacterium]
MKTFLVSLRILALLTFVTGIAYPLVITAIGRAAFPHASMGSLIKQDGQIIGSELLAQKTEDPLYFRPRPSAADYSTVPSGASNLGPASNTLKKAIEERRTVPEVPSDLLTTSGSGLDPHITPEAARYEAARVAAARHLPVEPLIALVDQFVEGPQFGLFGEARVNVLKLNLALSHGASAGH